MYMCSVHSAFAHTYVYNIYMYINIYIYIFMHILIGSVVS